MSYLPFSHFIQNVYSDTSLTTLFTLVKESTKHCYFIKNQSSQYLYANQNFIDLMGVGHLKALRQASDEALTKDKNKAKKYRALDESIFEQAKSLEVEETLEPKCNAGLIKTVSGSLYPLYQKNHKAEYVLGIVSPKNQLLRLDWEQVFQLSIEDLKSLLVKRSYSIRLSIGKTTLSRMEIITLSLLLKGHHAGEIAQLLFLKQTTIESYVVNIKDKLGVNSKSELINIVIVEKILGQIVL